MVPGREEEGEEDERMEDKVDIIKCPPLDSSFRSMGQAPALRTSCWKACKSRASMILSSVSSSSFLPPNFAFPPPVHTVQALRGVGNGRLDFFSPILLILISRAN